MEVEPPQQSAGSEAAKNSSLLVPVNSWAPVGFAGREGDSSPGLRVHRLASLWEWRSWGAILSMCLGVRALAQMLAGPITLLHVVSKPSESSQSRQPSSLSQSFRGHHLFFCVPS